MNRNNSGCGYTILEKAVLADTNKFDKNEVLAYMALNYFSNTDKQCFPSYDEIAKVMRTSRRTAITAINGLIAKGIVVVENRQSSEKKKEMTSNLYTLISYNAWEKAKADNRLFMIKRKTKYVNIVSKAKATKLSKELDKKNKPECESDLSTTNISTLNECFLDSTSITLKPRKNQQEIFDKNLQETTEVKVEDSENVKILKDNNIKFAPINKDRAMIDALDTNSLKEAITITNNNASVPNWNYVKRVYEDLLFTSKQNNNRNSERKTKFHNINQTYSKYAPDELEKLLQENQKSKFSKPVSIGEEVYKKTGFHNFDETFTQYTPEEFDSMVDRAQAIKW